MRHKSVSIIGLDKNTGKTECLNYILRRMKNSGLTAAVTSIGLDGESNDLVTNTPKPGLAFFEGLIFATSEKHYRLKKITSEILDVSERKTALGRLVTARCKGEGNCLISGPSDTAWLKSFIDSMERFKVDITLIDGAISRKSLASPAVTDCLLLATGATVSANINQLVKKTKFAVDLIQIPQYPGELSTEIHDKESGLWVVSEKGDLQLLQDESFYHFNVVRNDFFHFGNTLVFTGMITDRTLEHLESLLQRQVVRVVVKDFTRIFVSPEKLLRFESKGGQIFVLNRSQLIAVCVNPYSPTGYHLESDEMIHALEKVLTVPVFDVKKLSA